MSSNESTGAVTALEELTAELAYLASKEHDYNSSAEAIWQAALAAFNFMANQVGATGFQASWAALRFYGQAMHIDGPFLVLRAEDALYPQYDLPGRLQQFLDEARDWLADEARKSLAEYEAEPELSYTDDDGTTHTMPAVAPRVLEHWRKLITDAGPNRAATR